MEGNASAQANRQRRAVRDESRRRLEDQLLGNDTKRGGRRGGAWSGDGSRHWQEMRRRDVRIDAARLPLVALERLVGDGGAVPGDAAHEDEEQDGDGHHGAAVGGREEAEHRADDGDERHAEQLHARADRDGEQRCVGRRAQHVGVHQLPAALLEQLLLLLDRVVLLQVAARAHGRRRVHKGTAQAAAVLERRSSGREREKAG
eukprot:1775587-Pleurochrysis_carterae.AAC.11